MAAFWYNTAVYPISLETSSNRMLLNLDGTVTMQCGETEIGQGADTAYAQMTAEAVGLKSYTGRTRRLLPGYGHHAHRPRRLRQPPDLRRGLLHPPDGDLLRQKILQYATKLTRQAVDNMDIVDGNIIRKGIGGAHALKTLR